jgi:hypothetical protein
MHAHEGATTTAADRPPATAADQHPHAPHLPHLPLKSAAPPAPSLLLGGLILVFAFTALFVAAFHNPKPHEIDVGVVAPQQQAAQVQQGLDRALPGAFHVRAYASESAARQALLDTDVHGVLVPGRPQARVLVAGAYSVPATDVVERGLSAAAKAQGASATVQDLKPLPQSDSRGLSSFFTIVGTLIPSLLFGVALSVFGGALAARVRWGAVAAYAVLAGLVVAFNVDTLVGALQGHFLSIALIAGLLALATAAATHGLGRLLGPPGLGLAVLVVLLYGLSSSGGALSYQFEPGAYRAVSQLLPPGAALTALRNVQYFDWSATTGPILVLCAWIVGGLGTGLLGERFGPRHHYVVAHT